MRKLIGVLSSLSLAFGGGSALISAAKNKQYINIVSEDFYSKTHERVKRLYVDSTKDDKIPDISNSINRIYKKVKRNSTHNFKNNLLTLNTKNTFGGKERFLSTFKSAQINFSLGFNFWNSFARWTIPTKKDVDFTKFAFDFDTLKNEKTLFKFFG
ncbi:hypothetical protein [[Acholeplasma] multilocale]|uniref:hypothetical protein n=1 Tax=[Acholeplasma] multilocale TaxID=264638 RepID=UPI00047AE5F4|nr:hypothetical protein [[Acholeplasma] multilocale]